MSTSDPAAPDARDWRPAAGSSTQPPVDFSTLVPGLALSRWIVTVTEDTAARLSRGVGRDTDTSAPVTPALAGNLCVGMFFRILPRNILHTAQSITVHSPAHAGDDLEVNAEVASVGVRRERAYVTITGAISVGDRLVWAVGAEAAVPGVDTAHLKALAGEPLGQPEAAPVVALGSHELTLDEMEDFSGPNNFHSDREIARRFGYERPIAQGMHAAEFALALLAESDAAPWPASGSVDLRFVGPAAEGDMLEITVSGRTQRWLQVGVAGADRPAVVGRYRP